MGCVSTITWTDFPKQSEYVNRRVCVCFHFDTSRTIMGTIVRDDREEPCETIIVLDDGHVAGIGRHDDLLKTCPVYQEIYDSQFRKEAVTA